MLTNSLPTGTVRLQFEKKILFYFLRYLKTKTEYKMAVDERIALSKADYSNKTPITKFEISWNKIYTLLNKIGTKTAEFYFPMGKL